MDLSWTATGDDGSLGAATLYQVRYSTTPITSASFYDATKAAGAPEPGAPGSPQSMQVTALAPGACYYFAIKAFDEWGNGPISNLVKCGTRPLVYTITYCRASGEDAFQRCTFNGSFGTCGCTQYTCVPDATCTQADPVPIHACGNYCL